MLRGIQFLLPNTIDWNTWKAGIAYGVNGDVTNSNDSTNTRTATLEFINDTNPSNPITLTQATNNFQGPAEGKITFKCYCDIRGFRK